MNNTQYYEVNARYALARSQVLLTIANELEAIGRDGDAYLARENAYWVALDATSQFADAFKAAYQAAQQTAQDRA